MPSYLTSAASTPPSYLLGRPVGIVLHAEGWLPPALLPVSISSSSCTCRVAQRAPGCSLGSKGCIAEDRGTPEAGERAREARHHRCNGTPFPTVRCGGVRGGEAVRRGGRGGEARTAMPWPTALLPLPLPLLLPCAAPTQTSKHRSLHTLSHLHPPPHVHKVGHRQSGELGVAVHLFAVARGAGLGSGAVWGGAGRGGAVRRGGRGGEARTEMLPPTLSRLFIVSELRLPLLYTCRGDEGAGLGSGAVWGWCGEGGQCEGRERERRARRCFRPRSPGCSSSAR